MPKRNPLTRSGTCGFLIHHKGQILVCFDTDRILTELMKSCYQAKWHKGAGCWVLPEILCPQIRRLLAISLDYLIHASTDHDHEGTAGYVPGSDDWQTLQVQPGAPKLVVDAAYRALAMMYHPDRNGSVELMAKINGAYDRLKKVLV